MNAVAENEDFILVDNGYGRYIELDKNGIFHKMKNHDIEVYDLIHHMSNRSYYTSKLSISFWKFLIAYAEREGITIEEDVLNNSIEPEEYCDDKLIQECTISKGGIIELP